MRTPSFNVYPNVLKDINLPHIPWDSVVNTSGANEVSFIEILNDHYLSQMNNTPTRGRNILDLVITSIPDHVSTCEVLSPEQAEVFTDHCVISFEFSAFIKAPTKTHRSVYDYEKGDFEGLRTALSAINLSAVLGCDDINIDWQQWRDTFLAAVSDYIPMKRSSTMD